MENNDYLCTTNSNFKSTMDFDKTFERYGTTQSEMAEKMNILQPSLSRSIRNGDVKIKQVEQMADICGVSLGEFVGSPIPKEVKLAINGQEYTYELKKVTL